ncbi:MAG: heme-binding protein [Deltaproteobacteria bacterium]|nr:heme-binding protein [Deltaproteobacteria bacterium]
MFRVDAAGNASRRAFCQNLRNFLIGSTDPGRQLDCLQGVQDFPVGAITGLQNGFHIFQGAVPIYRGNTLVGAIGVSGDGAAQDDFVPFVALDEVRQRISNAAASRRRSATRPGRSGRTASRSRT